MRLANAPLPFEPPLDGSSAASVERVREQARIQVEGADLPKPIHELLLAGRRRAASNQSEGCAIAPRADAGDLFLDLEGDPYAFDDGVDYLFGSSISTAPFTPIWSFDPRSAGDVTLAGEKAAFERLMDLLVERLER